MREKDLINDIKDESDAVRNLERLLADTRTRRATAFLNAADNGMTYRQIAQIAKLSIHTVQAELRGARRNTNRGGNTGGNH